MGKCRFQVIPDDLKETKPDQGSAIAVLPIASARLFIKNKTPQFDMRGMQTDANEFKTKVHEGFTMTPGAPRCLTVFDPGKANHNMFARHLTNEFPQEHEVNGRKKVVWKGFTHKPDQHWLDAQYPTMVGASYRGCAFPGGVAKKSTLKRRTGKRLTQNDINRMRRRRAS